MFQTDRLTARELRPDDVDFTTAMLADPEVARSFERVFSRAEAEAWVALQLERYERDGHGLWLIVERPSGEPVGQVGLIQQRVEGAREPEVGWVLHRPHWGRGYATEAAAATLRLARRRWRYQRLISLIRPANQRSQRVAERIGMQPGRRVEFRGLEHVVYQTAPREARRGD